MRWLKENFRIVLAIFITLLTFAMFFAILMVDIEQKSKDIIIYLLGVLSAIITQIVSFYFGSSDGSSKKTDLMTDMMNKNNNVG